MPHLSAPSFAPVRRVLAIAVLAFLVAFGAASAASASAAVSVDAPHTVVAAKPGGTDPGTDEPGTHPGKGNGGTDNGRDGSTTSGATGGTTGAGAQPASGTSGTTEPASLDEVVESAASADPVDTPGLDTAPRTGFGDSTSLGTSMKTAHDVHLDAEHLAATGGLAAAFVFLFAFPAELLRLTLVNNYWRISAWFAAARRRAKDKAPRLDTRASRVGRAFRRASAAGRHVWATLLVRFPRLGRETSTILVNGLAAAVILSFADPHFGFHGNSARLVLAIFLSTCLMVVVVNAVVRFVAVTRYGTAATFRAMPAALLFMTLGVVASRILHFEPGFLLGLVMGVTLARHMRKEEEAGLAFAALGTFFALAIASWIGYGVVSGGHENEGFWHELAKEALTTGTLEGFMAVVIGMLPMAFLEGRAIFAWSRRVWMAAYLVVLVTFITLVVPMSGDFHEVSGNVVVVLAAFLAFSAVALAVWNGFRLAEKRDEERERERQAELARAKAKKTSSKKKATSTTRKTPARAKTTRPAS